MSESPGCVPGDPKSPTLLIVPFANVKFVTCVPRMPLAGTQWQNEPWIVMFVNEGLNVFVNEMASLNMFWMRPPEPLPPSDELPSPVTVRPPLEPVLLSTIPDEKPTTKGSPAEMLLKVSPPAPIVVFATFRAVANCVVRLLPAPVTLTVPPLTAVNAGLLAVATQEGEGGHTVETTSPPEKVTVPLS